MKLPNLFGTRPKPVVALSTATKRMKNVPHIAVEQESPAFAPRPPRPAPELLAPAGDWECARAAVENGADAIYFGLEKFNARMKIGRASCRERVFRTV